MEYAKYIAPKYVDWTGITDKFAAAVTDVGVKREKAKQDLADINQQSLQNIGDLQMTKTESFNNKMITYQDYGREKANEWYKLLTNGSITPTEYKRRMANLNNGTATLANTAKTYDERVQEYMKRQQKDENGNIVGSSVESDYYLANFGMLSDLKDKQFEVGDDGTVYVSQYDTEGKQIGRASIDSVNKVDNMMLNRVDVNKSVNEFAKTTADWEKWKRVAWNGEMSITDPRLRTDFKIWKQQVAQAIAGSPDRMLSVLVDNGGLKYPAIYAHSEQEAKQKVAQAIQNTNETRRRAGAPEMTPDEIKEMSMSVIRMGGDGKPLLTEEQADKAYELVRRSLEYQLKHEEKGSAGSLPDFGGSRSGGSGDDLKKKYPGWSAYGMINAAWTSGNSSKLTSANPNYKFTFGRFSEDENGNLVPDKNGSVYGVSVGKLVKNKGGEYKETNKTVITNPRDLSPYIYGEGTDANGVQNSYRAFDYQKLNYMNDPSTNKEMFNGQEAEGDSIFK